MPQVGTAGRYSRGWETASAVRDHSEILLDCVLARRPWNVAQLKGSSFVEGIGVEKRASSFAASALWLDE